MALTEGQVQVRSLVMGPGTPYKVLPGFDPFSRTVRANQTGPRAWNHGTWSGAEWADEAVVPIPLRVTGPGGDTGSWLAVHRQLAAAFAPVGDSGESVEMRWHLGGDEYVMFGRPRMVRPRSDHIAVGKSTTQCAFAAQDPRIYSGDLHTVSTGLPTQAGGLTVPLTVPFIVQGQVLGGEAEVVNDGTAAAPLLARIDGFAPLPRLTVVRPDGSVQQVRMTADVPAGQWIEIDTAAGTVFANGLPTASRRGQTAWDIDPYPLLPGRNRVLFAADDFVEDAQMVVSYRSAWW